MAFLLRAFSRGEKQKDKDSSADFVNKTFRAELSNIRSKLAVEDDDMQFLLEMIYDSSFPESQKFLKDPTKDRLFAHKETVSKLLFGLAAKGVPVTQLIVGHMQKYGTDSIPDTLLTLLELIRPLLISKEIPEFTSDDLLDAIDVQWHSPLRGGSRPQSPFQSPRTSVSASPRFSVSSPRGPFSIYYPGQTPAQDLVSPRRSGPLGSNFKSQSDDSPRPSPNSGWDASPRFKGTGLSLPQGQNLQSRANKEKELDNNNLTISQRRQQSETPKRDSSLKAVSTEINHFTEEDGQYLPERKLENSVTSIQTDNSSAQERPEASSKMQHGTQSSQLPHVVHLENMLSFEHLKENHVVEGAGVSAQAQSGYNGSNLFHPGNTIIENQQKNGGGKGPDVGDNNGRISDVSSSLSKEGANDTHQEVIPVTLVQREAGQESEAENKSVREMPMSDLSKEEELNTKSGVEGVPTKPSSEIQRDSLDRISKDIDDSTNSEDEIETRRELGDVPIENSDYSNFVCGDSPVEGHIFGNFDAGNKIDRALHSKNLPPNSKDGQGKEAEKDDNVSPRSELYEPGGGEGNSTSFANMPEKNLDSEEKPQVGKYINVNEEKFTADSKLDPKFIGDPSLSRKDNIKEKPPFGITDYEDPSSKNSQARRFLLFEQGAEEIEAQKAEGPDTQHLEDQYNFLGGHTDLKEHHRCGILEPDLSSKSGVESLPSMGGDEAEVDGGVIHDLELNDKALPVPAASITDSSQKEADYVEGGSMKDNKSLSQFTGGADLFPVADTEHGDVASSISSQVCQGTNDGGEAPTSKNVDEGIFLGNHNSNVAGDDVTSFGQPEEAENSVSKKHNAETVQIGEGEDETTQQVEVASVTPAELKIGFDEKVISKAESKSGQELAPAQIDDSNTANTIGHHMSHTAEIIPSRIDHERNLSEAEAKEFPVSSHESKAGVSDVAGEMDPNEAGSSENEEVPRNFDSGIPSNVSAHVGEADVISGDEESKLVETREEFFCVEKHHDSPGISYLEMSPTNDDGYGDRGGEGDNAPVQENDHEDELFCEKDQSKAGGNKALFLEEAVASEHFGDDMKFTEKEISCVPDEGNEFNTPAISGSEASLRNDESERMLTSDHYSGERLVAEEDESMAGEEATKLMDVHGEEEALTSRSAKEEEINFTKDREILGAFSTLKPSRSIDDSDKAPHSQHGDQAGVSEKLKELKLYEGKTSVPAGSEEGDVVVIKHIINRTDRTGSGGENFSAVQASKNLIAGNDKHDVAITNDIDRHDVDSFLSGHIGDEASSADCDMKLVDTGYVVPIRSIADEASEQVEGAAKRKESEDTVAPDTGDVSGDYESNRAEDKDITPSRFEDKEACASEDIKDTSRWADHIFEPATSDNAADSIPAVQHRYFEAEYPFLVSGDPQDEIVESPHTSRKESDISVEVVHESPAQVEDQSQCVASNHGQERAEDSNKDSRSDYQGEVVESPDTSRKETDSSVEVFHEFPAQVEDQFQCVASNHGHERAQDSSEDSRSNYQGEVVESPDTSRKESDSSVEVVHESPAQVEDQSQFAASNHGQERAEDHSEDSRSDYQGEVVESPDKSGKESDSSVEVLHESPGQVEDQFQCVALNHGHERAEDNSEDGRSNYQGEVFESPDTSRKESDSSVEIVHESPAQVEDQSQFAASNHGQERAEDHSEDSRSDYQGEVVESRDVSGKESDSSVEVLHESPGQVEDQFQCVALNHGHERAEDNSEDSRSNYQGEVFESPDTSRKESDSSVEVVHEPPAQVEDQSQFAASNHGQERAEDHSEDSRSDYQGEVVESRDVSGKESDSSVEVLHESPGQVEDQFQCVALNHGHERAEDNSEDGRSNYQGEVFESPDTSRKESDSSVEVVHESPAQVEDQSQCVESNHGQERDEENSQGGPSNGSPTIAVTAPVEAQTNIEAFHPAVVANAKEESRRNNFGPQIRDFGTEALKKNLSDSRYPNLSKEQSIEKGFDANILQAENSWKPTSEETKLLSRVEQPGNGQMSIPEGPLTGILHNKMTKHEEDRMFDRASTTRAPLSSTQMSAPILLQPIDQNFDRDYRKHKSHIRQWRLKFSRMCCSCCCRSSPTL